MENEDIAILAHTKEVLFPVESYPPVVHVQSVQLVEGLQSHNDPSDSLLVVPFFILQLKRLLKENDFRDPRIPVGCDQTPERKSPLADKFKFEY